MKCPSSPFSDPARNLHLFQNEHFPFGISLAPYPTGDQTMAVAAISFLVLALLIFSITTPQSDGSREE